MSGASSTVFSNPNNSELWDIPHNGSETQPYASAAEVQIPSTDGGPMEEDHPGLVSWPVKAPGKNTVAATAATGLEGLELSECGQRLVPGMTPEEAHRSFDAARVRAKDFSSRGREIMASEVGCMLMGWMSKVGCMLMGWMSKPHPLTCHPTFLTHSIQAHVCPPLKPRFFPGSYGAIWRLHSPLGSRGAYGAWRDPLWAEVSQDPLWAEVSEEQFVSGQPLGPMNHQEKQCMLT